MSTVIHVRGNDVRKSCGEERQRKTSRNSGVTVSVMRESSGFRLAGWVGGGEGVKGSGDSKVPSVTEQLRLSSRWSGLKVALESPPERLHHPVVMR